MKRIAFALLPLLAACGTDDVIGVHLTLQQDGTGSLTVRALDATTQPVPAEDGVEGVEFSQRAALRCAQGAFEDITEVRVGGIHFERDGEHNLRVRVPRGEAAAWHALLAPGVEAQPAVARTFDPESSNGRKVGTVVKISIELPGTVVAQDVLNRDRGVETDKEDDAAFLWLPVRLGRTPGNPLLWSISWQSP